MYWFRGSDLPLWVLWSPQFFFPLQNTTHRSCLCELLLDLLNLGVFLMYYFFKGLVQFYLYQPIFCNESNETYLTFLLEIFFPDWVVVWAFVSLLWGFFCCLFFLIKNSLGDHSYLVCYSKLLDSLWVLPLKLTEEQVLSFFLAVDSFHTVLFCLFF